MELVIASMGNVENVENPGTFNGNLVTLISSLASQIFGLFFISNGEVISEFVVSTEMGTFSIPSFSNFPPLFDSFPSPLSDFFEHAISILTQIRIPFS